VEAQPRTAVYHPKMSPYSSNWKGLYLFPNEVIFVTKKERVQSPPAHA
jgi:hypothetical protein